MCIVGGELVNYIVLAIAFCFITPRGPIGVIQLVTSFWMRKWRGVREIDRGGMECAGNMFKAPLIIQSVALA